MVAAQPQLLDAVLAMTPEFMFQVCMCVFACPHSHNHSQHLACGTRSCGCNGAGGRSAGCLRLPVHPSPGLLPACVPLPT